MPQWGNTHLAYLLGTSNVMVGRYQNGLCYPTLQMMQKFEIVFGWPLADQVQYIPYYWHWPEQSRAGVPQADPTDLRFAMKLGQIIREWTEANPRTLPLDQIRQHPALPHKRLQPGDPRVRNGS
jgi:hypothetical protein